MTKAYVVAKVSCAVAKVMAAYSGRDYYMKLSASL